MPRKYHRSRKQTDLLARQFYNDKLRHNPSLRQQCEDRHVLDDTISAWKDEQRLNGVDVRGMSRSVIVFSLRSRWKLIERMVREENVIVWRDGSSQLASNTDNNNSNNNNNNNNVNSQSDRVAKTIERIRNSRQEMENNRNGITIDQITLLPEGNNTNNGVLRINETAIQSVCIRNDSYEDMHCSIKDEIARQRGIRIEGDKKSFMLPALSSHFITVSYTPKRFCMEKAIIVFDFTMEESDYSDDEYYYEDYNGGCAFGTTSVVKKFSITRYITIRAGDPDDYDIIKPTAPYEKKKAKRGDGNKFVNPVKAASSSRNSQIVPFRNNLGRYHIPEAVLKTNRLPKEDVEKIMHDLYVGKGRVMGGLEDDFDYSSLLTMENYGCLSTLLCFEELQMQKDITTYDMEDAPLRRDGRRYYTLRVPGLAENRPSVLKGDKIIISVKGRGKYEGVVHRTTNEDAIIEFAASFNRVYIDGLRVDVRFTFSRTTLRTSHQALRAAQERKDLFRKILFPEMLNMEDTPLMTPLNSCVINSSQLRFYNRTLNQEQESAVVGILQSMARPAPYLIYGPPVSMHFLLRSVSVSFII